MTYQVRAPKKAYFAAGFKAGFEAALDSIDLPLYGMCPHGEEVSVYWNVPQFGEADIDEAWDDYCEYWRNKAMEEVRDEEAD